MAGAIGLIHYLRIAYQHLNFGYASGAILGLAVLHLILLIPAFAVRYFVAKKALSTNSAVTGSVLVGGLLFIGLDGVALPTQVALPAQVAVLTFMVLSQRAETPAMLEANHEPEPPPSDLGGGS